MWPSGLIVTGYSPANLAFVSLCPANYCIEKYTVWLISSGQIYCLTMSPEAYIFPCWPGIRYYFPCWPGIRYWGVVWWYGAKAYDGIRYSYILAIQAWRLSKLRVTRFTAITLISGGRWALIAVTGSFNSTMCWRTKNEHTGSRSPENAYLYGDQLSGCRHSFICTCTTLELQLYN